MATLPTPKSGIRIHQKILTVGSKNMLLTIHESNDSYTLFIGGPTIYCIDCILMKEDSPFARIQDVTVGHLSHIYYNTDCSIGKNFKRGEDTNMILKLLISYIKLHFPYITRLSFTDASYRTCDNNQVVELAEMNYISTGQTWYEKNFDAYIAPEYKPLFVQMESQFQEKKHMLSWEMMKSFINTPLPLEEPHMAELFHSSATWQEFFGNIRSQIGVSKFCMFVAPWLHSFFQVNSTIRFSGIPYLLPLTKTIALSVSEYRPTIGGGRRGTKRRLKKRPICDM